MVGDLLMRLRLLLIFLLAIVGMGADCGGSGSSHDGSSGTSFSASGATTEGGENFVPPVPEPNAALVFGLGVLLAGAAVRRSR
jgi:hypothetical protein